MKRENGFWKVCEALDSVMRVKLIEYLMSVERTEFPCVSELAELFRTSEPAMSVHLRKLANAGLVAYKWADRRVYYRAFATTPAAERVLAALRRMLARHPNGARIEVLVGYAHALSHERRHAIVRCLNEEPGLALKDICVRIGLPPPTAVRLLADLNRARIVDMHHRVLAPKGAAESVLLSLTLA